LGYFKRRWENCYFPFTFFADRYGANPCRVMTKVDRDSIMMGE
jgi:hypothetical protein